MCEPPCGGSRIVAGPFTLIPHPSGAMNVFPATVVFGVSAAMRSIGAALGSGSLFPSVAGGGSDLAGLGDAAGWFEVWDEHAIDAISGRQRRIRMGRQASRKDRGCP